MPGTSNFLPWGPSSGSAVQETDAQYLADQNRLTGAPVNADFPSALANKLFVQLAAMVYALGQFIANQGFNASDANLATLITNLTAALQAVVTPNVIVVPFSATPNFAGPVAPTPLVTFEMTLTGNVVTPTTSNLVPGQIVTYIFHQDGPGGRLLNWPTGFSGGLIDTAPNRTSSQQFMFGHDGVWRPLGPMISTSATGGS